MSKDSKDLYYEMDSIIYTNQDYAREKAKEFKVLPNEWLDAVELGSSCNNEVVFQYREDGFVKVEFRFEGYVKDEEVLKDIDSKIDKRDFFQKALDWSRDSYVPGTSGKPTPIKNSNS